jgi:hypothetical protein
MPREIFEDIVDEELQELKKLKPGFKSLVKGHGLRFKENSLECFKETLAPYSEFTSLSAYQQVLLHDYFLEKLRQK